MLVVFGHLVATGTPEGNEWYWYVKRAIYSFHMPLFMYLSGFVFFVARYHLAADRGFPKFALKRSQRLLVPFALFGLLIVLGKYTFQHIGNVDDPPSSILEGMRRLVFDTSRSPALSIWYVFVLFVYSLITPLLWRLTCGRWTVILAVAFLALIVDPGDDFYLNMVFSYYVFFLVGGISASYQDTVSALMSRGFVWFAVLFAVSFLLIPLGAPRSLQLTVIGLCSLWPIHQLIKWPPLNHEKIFLWIGAYAFVIYLFNTILIGLAKAAFVEFFPFRDQYFLLAVPILFAAGAFGPILVKVAILRKFPYLDRLTQ